VLLASLGSSILLNIPRNTNNYFPMTLSPTFTSIIKSSNIADLLSKPLPTHHQRYTQRLIGDISQVPFKASVAAPTVVGPAPVPKPTVAVDTGAYPSVCHCSISDFLLPVAQASYGLKRSPLDSSLDPYTLITGEDISVDLSFPDLDLDLVSYSDPVSYTFQAVGAAILVFIFNLNLDLITILVEPLDTPDWLHWIPIPRLTPTGSYFHISGLDYLQAFALFHFIPIWIALVLALLPFRFE